MSELTALLKRNLSGDASPQDNILLERIASNQDRLSRDEREEYNSFVAAKTFRYLSKIDPDKLSDKEAEFASQEFLRSTKLASDPTGLGFYESDPAKMPDSVKKVKILQRMFIPGMDGKYEDTKTRYNKLSEMNREQLVKELPVTSATDIAARAEMAVGRFTEWAISIYKPNEVERMARAAGDAKQIEDANIEKLMVDALNEDFMSKKAKLESMITSDEARNIARVAAETGYLNRSALQVLSPVERSVMSEYVQLLKKPSDAGVWGRSAYAFGSGVKDITVGSVEFLGENAIVSTLALGEIFGNKQSADWLRQYEKKVLDDYVIEQATRDKYRELGAVEEGIIGIAGSIPLMASFFLGGKGAVDAAAKLGMSGRYLTAFKALRKYPIVSGTLAMADEHRSVLLANGVERGPADIAALGTAIANMYVEKAAFNVTFGLSKTQLSEVVSKYLVNKIPALIAKAGARGIESFTAETAEEIIQGLNEELVTQYLTDKPDAIKLTQNAADTFMAVWPTTAGFGIFGMSGDAVMAIRSRGANTDTTREVLEARVQSEEYVKMMDDIKGNATQEQKQAEYVRLWNIYRDAEADEKADALMANGVNNIDEASAMFEQDNQRYEQLRSEMEEEESMRTAKRQAMLERLPEARNAAVAYAKAAGLSTEFVETIEGASSEYVVGQILNKHIRIKESWLDPVEIVRHEVAHEFIDNIGVLNDKEMSVLRESVDMLAKELSKAGLDVSIYDTKAKDARTRELIADAFSILNPQQRSIVQKVMDIIERVVNALKGKGFNSLRSILREAEERGFEYARENAQRAGEAGTQEGIDGQAESGVRLRDDAEAQEAERRQVDSFRELSEAMAGRIVAGRKVDSDYVSKLMPEGATYRASDVVNEANAIAGDIGYTGDAMQAAESTATRMKIANAAGKRHIERLSKRMLKEGVRIGMFAEKKQAAAKQAVKQEKAMRADADNEVAKLRAPSASKLYSDGLKSQTENMRLNNASAFLSSIDEMMERYIKGEPDSKQNLAMRRSVIANVLRDETLRNVSQKDQASIQNAIAKFADPRISESRKNIDSVAGKIVERISKSLVKGTVADTKSKLQKLIKRTLSNKNKSAHATFLNKTVGGDVIDKLKNIQVAVDMKADEVDRYRTIAIELGDNLKTVPQNVDQEFESPININYKELVSKFRGLSGLSATEVSLKALSVLDMYGDFANMTPAKAQEAMDEVNSIISTGKDAHLERVREFNANATRINDAINGIIAGVIEQIGADKARSLMTGYGGVFEMLEVFERYNITEEQQAVVDELKVMFSNARQKSHGDISATIAVFNKEFEKQFDAAAAKDLMEMRDDYRKFSLDWNQMNKSQLLDIVLQHSQPDIQEQVAEYIDKGKTDAPLVQQWMMLEEIEEILGEDIIAFGSWFRDLINAEVTERLAKAYEMSTGSRLDIRPDYWSILRDKDPSVDRGAGLSLFKSFLKKRSKSQAAVATDRDAFAVGLKHIEDSIRFVEYAQLHMLMRETILSPDVYRGMQNAYGKSSAYNITATLADELNGRPLVPSERIAGVDMVIKAVVYRGLFGNVISGAKQVADFSAPSAVIDGYWKYLLEANTPEGRAAKEKMMKHPAIEARAREGYNVHQAEALQDASSRGPVWMRKALKGGMRVPQIGDMLSISISAGPVYRAVLELPYIQSIKDAEARDFAAQNMAVTILERTLQSPHKADRPVSVRRGGSYAGLVGVFTSALTQKAQQTISAWAEAKNKGWKDSKANKKLMKRLVAHHVIAGFLQWGVSVTAQMAFTDDEFDNGEWFELIATTMLGPNVGIPVFGILIESVMNGITGSYARNDVLSGVARDVYTVGRKVGGMLEHSFSEGDYESAMDDFIALLLKIVDQAPPTRQARDLVEKYLDAE